MSQLFELNRSLFLKIFETHQSKGLVSFTDILKICSSLKIFPDLLDSQEIQKIFSSVSSGNFYKITYLEFETFLKLIAYKLFAISPNSQDYTEIFLSHIKNYALKSYRTEIKTFNKKKISLKYAKPKKILSMSSNNNRSMPRLPESTKNIYSKKNVLELMSSDMIKLKKKKIKKNNEDTLTDRKFESYTFNIDNKNDPKIARAKKLLKNFKNTFRPAKSVKLFGARKIRDCCRIALISDRLVIQLKLCFQIWKLSY
jgi:hypothetical protein